jgi:hemerythrin
MALVTWQDSYSVNVRQFDDQHRQLFAIMNQLHDAMRGGKGSQVLLEVLASLIAYTQSHFSDEERLMKLHGYSGLAAQKKMHDFFVEKMRNYQRDTESGKGVITLELMNFLKDWLVQHIQREDVKYGPFMAQKGVA